MTDYRIEKVNDDFIVYNSACKQVKKSFECLDSALIYRNYLIKRDKRAEEKFKSCFLNT